MQTPGTGWAPDTSVCPDWANFQPGDQTYALAVATQVMWAATGRQFGLADITVRPCLNPQLPAYLTFPVAYDPGSYGGQWAWQLVGVPNGVELILGGTCGCTGACGCSAPTIPLPAPVSSIVAVTIDGAVLAAGNYRVDAGNLLVRQDGSSWPVTQNLALSAGQVGTWSVEYQRGVVVPALLNQAAGAYACEIARARAGGNCRLPQRVQSITRQGVDIQLVDQTDYLHQGLTGVQEVDQVIRAFNPDGLRARPRVVSPDLPMYR